jgi:hypothetical protein
MEAMQILFQNLEERLKRMGYSNIKTIIAAKNISDIQTVIKKLLKDNEKDFIDAVKNGEENPLEKFIGLSSIVFDMRTVGNEENITVKKRDVTWGGLEFTINVVQEYFPKPVMYQGKPTGQTAIIPTIRTEESSKIPWLEKPIQKVKREEKNPLYMKAK